MNVSFETLVLLAQAIKAGEVLRFDYPARDAGPENHRQGPPRRTEPHHLASSHGRWYLLGWDLDRTDWRLYSVDRIHPRVPNGPRFDYRAVPGGDTAEFVAARFKGRDVNEWPCRGTVILPLPAREVLPFAGDGTVTVLDENHCTLSAGAWSWGALAASFGRFEVDIDVVEPGDLRAAFATLARRYARTGRVAIQPGKDTLDD